MDDLKTIRCVASGTVDLARVQNEDGADDPKRRKFELLAYSGSVIDYGMEKLVIDLAGMQIMSERIPIFRDHDRTKIVGHAEAVKNNGASVSISGIISGAGTDAQEVVAAADNGFPWKASVGIDVWASEKISETETRMINGRDVTGPAMIVTESNIYETSFVPLGADANTRGVVFDLDSAKTVEVHFEQKEEQEMADKKDDGHDLDAARNSAIEEERKRNAELRAAFADDAEFAMEAMSGGLTVEAAKAKYADRLAEKVVEMQKATEAQAAKIAELQAKLEAASKSKPESPKGVAHTEGDAPKATYSTLMFEAQKAGMGKIEAMRHIRENHPDAYAEYIGGGKQED